MVAWVYTVDGVDLSEFVVPRYTRITSTGWRGFANASFRLQDLDNDIIPALEREVIITADGTRVFGGLLRSVDPAPIGANTARTFDLTCQDFGSLLFDDVAWGPDARRRKAESDKERVEWLISRWCSKGITASTYIQELEADLEPMDFRGMTIAECLDLICDETGGSWYVGQHKGLHYFDSEATDDSPWDFTDASPDGVATLPYWELRMPQDTAGLVNAVWIRGKGITGWRTDTASIALYGRREGSISAPWVKTRRQLDRRGDTYLKHHAWPKESGSFRTWAATGLRAGMVFQLTNAPLGLSGVTLRTAEVVQTISVPSGRGEFEVRFNGRRRPSFAAGAGFTRSHVGAALVSSIEDGERIIHVSESGPNLIPNSLAEEIPPGGTVPVGWTLGTGWTAPTNSQAKHGSRTFHAAPAGSTPGELILTTAIAVDRTKDHWVSVFSWMSALTAGAGQVLLREYASGGSMVAETEVVLIDAAEDDWTRHALRFGDVDTDEGPAFHASTTSVRVVAKGSGTCTFTWDLNAWQLEWSEAPTFFAPSWGDLPAGAVGITNLASGIEAVRIVAALPTLPDAAHPQGAVVFLTTDNKLYRSTGSAWTSVVPTTDLTGQVLGNQVSAGAITTEKLTIGSVTDNAVVNGGFEDLAEADPTKPASWTQGSGGDWVGSPSWATTTGALTGARALAITLSATTDTANVQNSTRRIPVAAGELWYVSAWVKGSSASAAASATVFLRFYDAAGTFLSFLVAASSVSLGTAWQKLQGSVTVPASAAAMQIQCRCVGSTNAGTMPYTYTWDDVVALRVAVSAMIAAGAITTTKLAAGAITSNELAANAVIAGKIDAAAISATEIQSNAISTDKLLVGGIGSLAVNNPMFVSTAGWTPDTSGGTGTFTASGQVGTEKPPGNSYGAIARTTGTYGVYHSILMPVRPAATVTMSFDAWNNSGSAKDLSARLLAYDSAGAYLRAYSFTVSTSASVFTRYNVTQALGSDVFFVRPAFYHANASTTIGVTDVRLSLNDSLNSATGNVRIDESGVTITNGKLVVASDSGATVIIDGTSNMFKISASGTLNCTASSTALNVATVTLTGLGTVSVAPASICYISGDAAATSPKFGSTYLAGLAKGFVAATSGGAVNQRAAVPDAIGLMDTVVTASQVVVELVLLNETAGSLTIYGKYYVLVEAAM